MRGLLQVSGIQSVMYSSCFIVVCSFVKCYCLCTPSFVNLVAIVVFDLFTQHMLI